ncbi:MAG: hypothetical protein J6V01_06750, partial [Clostridia bacterium]|nr:hypothetical protein [Clostridia bacterium]
MTRRPSGFIRLLSFAAAAVLALSSCGNKQEEPGPFDWFDYVIVTPASGLPTEQGAFGQQTNLLNAIKHAISAVSGAEPSHVSELDDETAHEIIVGCKLREDSKTFLGELREKDYLVSYESGRFYVLGGSDEALVVAIRTFINKIPTLMSDLSDGDIVRYTAYYPPVIPVIINGIDIEKYSFSMTKDWPFNDLSHFVHEFKSRFGYELKCSATPVYEAFRNEIASPGARYVVFGRGDGFTEDAPDAEPGTAVLLCNGSSIMIYSADDSDNLLYLYLIKYLERIPTEDGIKTVEI